MIIIMGIPLTYDFSIFSCDVVDSSYYLCYKQDSSTLQLLDLVSGPVFKPTDITVSLCNLYNYMYSKISIKRS